MIDGAYKAIAGEMVVRTMHDLAVLGESSPVSGDRLTVIHHGITGWPVTDPQTSVWDRVRA